MRRHPMSTEPSIVPTEEDLRWAADIFETRARFSTYAGSVALQVHSADPAVSERLVRLFGGGAYTVPGGTTIRWKLARSPMFAMLDAIRPFLTDAGRARIASLEQAIRRETQDRVARREIAENALFARLREEEKKKGKP
jgi:hypothetical protein